jgi:hypothetical protein
MILRINSNYTTKQFYVLNLTMEAHSVFSVAKAEFKILFTLISVFKVTAIRHSLYVLYKGEWNKM